MDSIEKLNRILTQRGIEGTPTCVAAGFSRAVYSQWNSRKTKPSKKALKQLADFLEIDVSELMPDGVSVGREATLIVPDVSQDVVSFPVIGGVAAGFDFIAYEDWSGDSIEIPRSYLHGRPQEDYFVLRVEGDSMYPDYQNGDHVLVLRQETMDRSGQVGVVIYDDESATLKRIEYVMGEDWMILRPINPMFAPVRIEGEALEHCRVLGVARMLIREVAE